MCYWRCGGSSSQLAFAKTSSQRRRPSLPELHLQLHTTLPQPLTATTMALPLRCARSGAAWPAQASPMRAAKFSTSVSRREINSDVRITRYCARFTCREQTADWQSGLESPFSPFPAADPRWEVCRATPQFQTTTAYTNLQDTLLPFSALRASWDVIL